MLGDDDEPGSDASRYYVKRASGKVFGPFDANAIQMMLKAGKIGSDAAISVDKTEWRAVSDVEAFAEYADDSTSDRDSHNETQLGGFAARDSDGEAPAPEADLPASAESGDADLPRSAGESGSGGGPDLPTPKDDSGGDDGSADLPRPADGGGDEGPPDLPTPKSDEGGDSPELPTSSESSEQADLPRSADDNLPKSGGGGDRADLPRSADDNLPSAGDGGSPDELPRSADDNLPGTGSSVEAADEEADDLFGEADDEEDELFEDSGDAAGEDDLFTESESGDDGTDGAPDEDLFGVDDEEDDLFGESGDDDDLFGDDDGEDDLFGESGDDDLFGDEPNDEEEDLFEASDPHAATASPQSELDDDSDFGDEELELGEQPPGGETGGDLGEPSGAEASGPSDDEIGGGARDLELDQSAAADVGLDADAPSDGAAQPASPGIPERERQDEQPDDERAAEEPEPSEAEAGGGSGGRLAALALLLVVAAGGAGAYFAFFTGEKKQQTDEVEQKKTVTIDLEAIESGRYPDLKSTLDRLKGQKLSGAKLGKHLLAASLFLARYESESVRERASSLAGGLENATDGYRALGRGAWAAMQGNLEVARAYLEPLYGAGDDRVAYFARLAAGIGHVHTLEDRPEDESETAQRRRALPTTADTEQEAPEALAGALADAGPPRTADAGATGAGSDATAPDGGTGDGGASPGSSDESGPNLAKTGASLLEKAATNRNELGDPLYWRGRLHEADGADDRALEAYRSALERQNDHVAARLRAARLEYDAGELGAAKKSAETVLSELGKAAGPPDLAEAYHVAGLVEFARAKNRKAIEAFRKALDQDPHRPATIEHLTEAYAKAGRWKKALEYYKSRKDLARKYPEVLLGMVRAHTGLEQWQSAINVLEKGEKRFPKNARFPYLLGRLHMERGAFTEAKKAMQRAVQNDPELLEAFGTLAQLTWRLDKDPKQAEYYIQQITRHPSEVDASVATRVAGFYRMSERVDRAEEWYREALERNPNHWPARLQLAKLLLDEKRGNEALELLKKARESGVEDIRLLAQLADAYRQTGKYDRAIQAINKVLDRRPEDPEFLFIRGLIHFDRGNHQNARRDFAKAHELKPLFHRAYFYAGRVAFEQENYGNAIKILRQVLDDHPENGQYRYWVGRTLEEQGRLEKALQEYRQVTKYEKQYGDANPELHVRRGQLLVELGYKERGKREIREALKIDPEMTQARLAMARAHYRTKDYENAIDQFEKALEDDPKVAWAQRKLGLSLIYTERKRQGAKHLQKAVQFGYEDPEIYKTLGYLYKELGKPGLAVESFKSYLREANDENIPTATRREMLDQIEELGG